MTELKNSKESLNFRLDQAKELEDLKISLIRGSKWKEEWRNTRATGVNGTTTNNILL